MPQTSIEPENGGQRSEVRGQDGRQKNQKARRSVDGGRVGAGLVPARFSNRPPEIQMKEAG